MRIALTLWLMSAPTAVVAHGVTDVQTQWGGGLRLDPAFAFDGGEVWAQAAVYGLGLEGGVLYRHQSPTRGGALRGGLVLRPLALAAATRAQTGWRWLDLPLQAGAVLGGVQGPTVRAALFLEVGVEVAVYTQGNHPAVGCRLRWTPVERPTTDAPTVLCGLALREAH
jgi:hypothetical protein